MSTPEIRRAHTRGAMRTGWLDARFSFSFADYHDAARPRFGPLLALNEDRVQPDTGFPMHPHRDIEIVMLPLAGAVEHHDDLGGHAIVRPGQWQWMRAGTGIRHRQWNPSPEVPDHHLQIWLEPRQRGLQPLAQTFSLQRPASGVWQTLVSPQASGGARDIGVDATVSLGMAAAAPTLACAPHAGGRYLHVVDGRVEAMLEGHAVTALDAGDAMVFFDHAPHLQLRSAAGARLLRFDTGPVDPATGQLAGLT